MYFFYIDESGNLDCAKHPQPGGGPARPHDRIYALVAVSLFEWKWRRFEGLINAKKRDLMQRVRGRTSAVLDLADCEVKSNWIRIPSERAEHPLLASLHGAEVDELIDVFLKQLKYMSVFAVVIDKDALHDHMDQTKLHRKAWELLLERTQFFLHAEHQKHQGILITDDVSKHANRALAMKHAYLLESGTTAQSLRNLVEMPMFVRSELSNGVQLADLVAYNFYRAFKLEDFDYVGFKKVLPYVWSSRTTSADVLDGLKVFPPESPLARHMPEIGRRAAAARVPIGRGRNGNGPRS